MLKNLRIIFYTFLVSIVLVGGFAIWYFNRPSIAITEIKNAIIRQINAVVQITTAQMVVEKTIEGKQQLTDFFPGVTFDNILQTILFKDQLEIYVRATVHAGFDFNAFSEQNISFDKEKNELTIKVPAPEILSVEIDDTSRVEKRSLGLLTKGNLQMETTLRKIAKDQLTQTAISNGIFTIAKENLKKKIEGMVNSYGMKSVIIFEMGKID